jgi:hypothetical protein
VNAVEALSSGAARAQSVPQSIDSVRRDAHCTGNGCEIVVSHPEVTA